MSTEKSIELKCAANSYGKFYKHSGMREKKKTKIIFMQYKTTSFN
jgi:hypothetical protein